VRQPHLDDTNHHLPSARAQVEINIQAAAFAENARRLPEPDDKNKERCKMAMVFDKKTPKTSAAGKNFFVPSYTERIKNLRETRSGHRKFAWSECASR